VQIAIAFNGSSAFSRAKSEDILLDIDSHIQSSPESVQLFKCDISLQQECANYIEHGTDVIEEPLVFIHSPYDGNIAYTHEDVSGAAIVRFAFLYLTQGNPNDIVQFLHEEHFYGLLDTFDPPNPLFVLFGSYKSPTTARVRAAFAAGASFFKSRVTFVEVKCEGRGSTREAMEFCRHKRVASYPTLGLFTVRGSCRFCRLLRSFSTLCHAGRRMGSVRSS
jgi:hypothetical protein